MHKELVISISDLRYVSISCPHCGTKVILDMQEKSAFMRKHGIFAPKKCPGCEQPYETAVQPNVDNLQRAYQSLLDISDRIGFRGEPTVIAEAPQ
jgi:phage terminase large subunit GpA-like protein